MKRHWGYHVGLTLGLCICSAHGCRLRGPEKPWQQTPEFAVKPASATELVETDAEVLPPTTSPTNPPTAAPTVPEAWEVPATADGTFALPPTSYLVPLNQADLQHVEFWNIDLHDAIALALRNSQVLREAGGTIIQNPEAVRTILDPALQATDPRFGVYAALSEYDALFSNNLRAENNDRALNNQFFGGGTRTLKQDFLAYRSGLSKTAATGSQFSFFHNTDYDASNAPGNQFPNAWNTNFELQWRQPLLQGRGMQFNQIAGPDGAPGVYNGVMVARTNTDLQLAEFELAVRNLVSNVENAYWDLYLSYRNLDAKRKALESSTETYSKVQAFGVAGRQGAADEAQARRQLLRFRAEFEDARTGRPAPGTRTFNGNDAGTSLNVPGVLVAERRLRLLMGIPSTDGRLLRPRNEPARAPIAFSWAEIIEEAQHERPELRRQQMRVRRQELELLAARNFLMPRLDTVAQYRWRGFGKDLLNSDDGQFANAYHNLFSGDFQEWQLGLEMETPLGMRKAHSAVRNAKLRLTREQITLAGMREDIANGLQGSVQELERAYQQIELAELEWQASQEEVDAKQTALQSGIGDLDLDQLLQAQYRLAESEVRYYRTLVDYALALKELHFQKGTILREREVILADSAHQLLDPAK